MKNIQPHEVHNPKRHKSYHCWTVPGYKSPWISKSFLQVTRNNIAQKWCPAARQGPIYKPTRSKLNPKCSYNSTGAFWRAYHPMLLLVGFQRINRPGNHITGCWLSSLGECTRRMMWGRSDRDTGGYVEFPPACLGCGVCHWAATERTGRGPDHVQPLKCWSQWTHQSVYCAFWDFFFFFSVIVNRKAVSPVFCFKNKGTHKLSPL